MKEIVGQYLNNEKVVSSDNFKDCVYPNCGCAEARLCMAENGANHASLALNLPHTNRRNKARE